MSDNTEDYVLNFVIPAGETGPTGPMGPKLPICYVNYNTSNNDKNLTINNAEMFNSNGEFSVNDDILTVNPGTYEITFCGKIEVKGTFQNNIMVALHESLGGGFSQPISGMIMILPTGTNCMHFSETRIINFDNTKNIFVIITNNNSVSATVSMGSLILKKI